MAVIELNDTNFESEIANKKVIVKYFADWCGSCKLFSPKFKRLSNDESNSDVLFVEVDAEKNEKARKLAKVDNLPFLATFQNGVLLDSSATSKEEFAVELINKLKAS